MNKRPQKKVQRRIGKICWRNGGSGLVFQEEEGATQEVVACVGRDVWRRSHEEADRVASLIASAPDLLEAVVAAWKAMLAYGPFDATDAGTQMCDAMDELAKAYLRATGRSVSK